jgi:hypothetical protein
MDKIEWRAEHHALLGLVLRCRYAPAGKLGVISKIMNITIEKIDRDKVIQVSENALGYVAEFTCPLVSGKAYIVPYGNKDEYLKPGISISVETSQEKVTQFKIESEFKEHSIKKLEKDFEYLITGTVVLNSDNEVFYIEAGDFTFALDIEETEGIIPYKGDYVSFTIHGLSLWDENT